MTGVDTQAIFPLAGAAPCVRAEAGATEQRESALPNVGTWTLEEGDSSIRLTIVHSGFGGVPQALAAPLFPLACRLVERRAAVSGRSSLYLALVG